MPKSYIRAYGNEKSSAVKRLLTSLLAVLFGFEAGLATAQVRLPDMGSSSSQVISPREAQEIGARAYREIRRQMRVVDDPLINEYITRLGQRLAVESSEPGGDYTFFVVANRSVNAFAIPGGYIGIHSGLMTNTQEESEVAGVLAHEVAHVTQDHIARIIEDMQQVSLPVMLGAIGVLIASGGNPNIAQAALAGSQAALLQRQINFTRSHEAEADRIGIKTLAAAGYNPDGMAQFFQRLERVNLAYGDGPSEFLRTHPVTTNRIAEAKSRARNMAAKKPSESAELEYRLMRERVRAIAAENPDEALRYFRQTLDMTIEKSEIHALQYGKAVALLRRDQAEEAADILNTLIKEDAERLPYELSLAEARVAAGQTDEGLAMYERLLDENEGRYPVKVGFAEALMQAGESAKAERLLRDVVRNQPRNAVLHRQYAKAADAAGRFTDARIAIAEAYLLEGHTHDALQQLRQAQKDPRVEARGRGRLEARYDEMWNNLSEEEREHLEDDFPSSS